MFLEDEPYIIAIKPDHPNALYHIGYIPNSLIFQWMDEIRYKDERAKDTDRHKSQPLTDPRNEQVWMRAVKEWLDNTRFVRDSGQSVCDFCAGLCGDCPQRWSDDPDSCDCCDGEYNACVNCPFRSDLLRHMERHAAHESPYEAMLFSPNPYSPSSIPMPAPDPSLAAYNPQPWSAQY